ncbi:transposase [Streptomyces sp. NPDC127051]|uniref:transposase n=1 Tax=Streptomyces sp. NPDC127051 TaxID=3347119 RepID=UPI003652C74E
MSRCPRQRGNFARELGVSSESLWGWVKKARAAQEAGSVSAGQSAGDRDEELKRLRKLTAEQAKTIEILKKSDGAFFAKESDR